MNRNSSTLTIQDIETLLDRKLQPIKDDLSGVKDDLSAVKDDLANVKHVVEHKVYKEMKEGFAEVNKRIDHLEELTMVIVEDHEEHNVRIKRLEKHTNISSNSN